MNFSLAHANPLVCSRLRSKARRGPRVQRAESIEDCAWFWISKCARPHKLVRDSAMQVQGVEHPASPGDADRRREPSGFGLELHAKRPVRAALEPEIGSRDRIFSFHHL